MPNRNRDAAHQDCPQDDEEDRSTDRQEGRPHSHEEADETFGTSHDDRRAQEGARRRTDDVPVTVDRYLAAVNTPRKRGRKVSKATLEQRLAATRVRARTATGTDRVLAAQQVRDLRAKIASASAADGADVKQLEAAFVKVAKKFGENRGISYGAWRDAGVPADVLKKAGVARTRS